ncbi:MAG: sugar ABC transporter permease [Firmicutes bacterium]|nr:sugar ABC transporter permease [Bacillota bacterium]
MRNHDYLILLLPALILYTGFVIFPFINTIRFSFYEWPGVGPMTWRGLGNYRDILFGILSDIFWRAFGHNIYYFLLSSVLQTLLGLFFALVLSSNIKGTNVFKTIYFIPNVLAIVAVGFLWNLLLNPQWGMVNKLLVSLGLESWAKPWLGDPKLAFPTVILVAVWRGLGFYILVYLAGITGIPSDLVEAAQIDGASTVDILRYVYLPLLLPTFLTLITLNFIWSFEAFDMIFVMQGAMAGPNYATDVLGTFFYRVTFGGMGASKSGMGLGAAVTTLMLIVILPVSLIQVKLRDRFSSEF